MNWASVGKEHIAIVYLKLSNIITNKALLEIIFYSNYQEKRQP